MKDFKREFRNFLDENNELSPLATRFGLELSEEGVCKMIAFVVEAISQAREEERRRWEKALPEKKDYKAETIFVEDCQTYMMGFNTCLKQIKKNLNINL